MPWYAMALSIMATQASAITFISTTGQAYVDGMRFVQFYFGLPIAMVILSATAVPIFHRASVYTAYEYLEKRFDSKTRALASVIFLIQRGVSVGHRALRAGHRAVGDLRLAGPGHHADDGRPGDHLHRRGGIQAVTWTDVQQMIIIFCGLIVALVMVIVLLPPDVSFLDAVYLAGKAGKLNAVDLKFDWNNRYNVWSGLIGGMFLALAYFGCDQSQVQRYLTGKSIAQSKLSLLFNAMAKVPMQFFILFVGAMVFVFYMFEQPPLLFERRPCSELEAAGEYPQREDAAIDRAFEARREAAASLIAAHRAGRHAETGAIDRRLSRRAEEIWTRPARDAGATGRQGVQRHQLHLPLVRHPVPAGRPGGPGDCRDLRRRHVGEFRRGQLAGHGHRDRHLQAPSLPEAEPTHTT